jgi:hypothetical protein
MPAPLSANAVEFVTNFPPIGECGRGVPFPTVFASPTRSRQFRRISIISVHQLLLTNDISRAEFGDHPATTFAARGPVTRRMVLAHKIQVLRHDEDTASSVIVNV